MFLRFIRLCNFRNIPEKIFEFSPHCNLIYGDNGQGKTNLLEAIVLLSTGRSFRTTHLTELIREKESSFHLEAEVVRETVSHRIRMSFDGQQKRLILDSQSFSHFHPLLGLMPSVLYAPTQNKIVTGVPADRRRFLDLQLAQSDPLYVHHLIRFYRAMKQRNCLLKQSAWEEMDPWEMEMDASASYLQKARRNLLETLKPVLEEEGKVLSRGEEIHGVSLRSTYTNQYGEELKKNRIKDQSYERTSFGPHRDDLLFFMNGKPSRLFASEGQQKTSLAALKISEWKYLQQKTGFTPLFCLDDIGHSLDPKREALLCKAIQNKAQVFITSPYDLDIQGVKIKINYTARDLKVGQ